jgi:hypothetical protein
MKTFLKAAIIAVAAACTLAACAPKQRHAHHQAPQVTHHAVKMQRLNDGRFAYYDNGFWWYYMLLNQPSSSSSNFNASGGRYSLPSGGTWTRSSQAPAREEVAEEEEIDVAENAANEPLTEEQAQQAEEAQQAQDEGQAGEQGTEAGESGTDSGSTDSGTSGGGDSGASGGGDSGASSGGDSGGGGGGGTE